MPYIHEPECQMATGVWRCRWVHPFIWAFVGVFVLWASFMQVIGWMEQVTYNGEPLIEVMRDVRFLFICMDSILRAIRCYCSARSS